MSITFQNLAASLAAIVLVTGMWATTLEPVSDSTRAVHVEYA